MKRLDDEAVRELRSKETLKAEINEALNQWESANRFFHYAVGQAQIDYAIHAIITAEKRYAMLLGKARQLKGQWPKGRG